MSTRTPSEPTRGLACEGVEARLEHQYRAGGGTPWPIQALEVRAGRIAGITYFLETDGSLFERLGLAGRLSD